jgi:hypothetical protein
MSETNYPVWIGPVLGGISLMTISAASSFYVENTLPAPKLLARDFILGAILLSIIMQVLPESTSHLIQFICGLVAFRLPSPSVGGGGENSTNSAALTSTMSIIESIEPEVKVGVPSF